MENVKGILTSRHSGSLIFERILEDLSKPGNGTEYDIRSFVVDGRGDGMRGASALHSQTITERSHSDNQTPERTQQPAQWQHGWGRRSRPTSAIRANSEVLEQEQTPDGQLVIVGQLFSQILYIAVKPRWTAARRCHKWTRSQVRVKPESLAAQGF
jgi:hypothetical protein